MSDIWVQKGYCYGGVDAVSVFQGMRYRGIINEVFLDGLKKPQKPMLFEVLEPKTTSTYSIWCGSRRQQW